MNDWETHGFPKPSSTGKQSVFPTPFPFEFGCALRIRSTNKKLPNDGFFICGPCRTRRDSLTDCRLAEPIAKWSLPWLGRHRATCLRLSNPDSGKAVCLLKVHSKHKTRLTAGFVVSVDLAGFEPATPSLQMRCSTK